MIMAILLNNGLYKVKNPAFLQRVVVWAPIGSGRTHGFSVNEFRLKHKKTSTSDKGCAVGPDRIGANTWIFSKRIQAETKKNPSISAEVCGVGRD
jgi:hypothetical protein